MGLFLPRRPCSASAEWPILSPGAAVAGKGEHWILGRGGGRAPALLCDLRHVTTSFQHHPPLWKEKSVKTPPGSSQVQVGKQVSERGSVGPESP